MQELDLCDVLKINQRNGSFGGFSNQRDGFFGGFSTDDASPVLTTALGTPVILDCTVPGLDPRDNLVFRALDAVEQACAIPAVPAGETLEVEVEKHIPAGGGLGGGSSDAAAMLKAYAQLAGIDALDERLVEAARKLGADVAFFLHGGCALLRDRGDVFERALPPLSLPIVLMGDAQGMSTAAIYQAFDADPPALPDVDALVEALERKNQPKEPSLWLESTKRTVPLVGINQKNRPSGWNQPKEPSLWLAAGLCANNLGPVACAQSERLQARIDAALAHPCVLNALVSGSGSTSFAICPDTASAERFAADIAPLCDWVRICA